MYKLMIVDDEPMIRNGLRTIIPWEDLGIEVVGDAQNGKQALSLIDYYEPDIILTDIKMPECDGLELLSSLQKHYSHIKVAVLSGYDDFQYVKTAMRLGAINYLLKPVDVYELTAAMREIIDTIQINLKNTKEKREYLNFLRRNTFYRILMNEISTKEYREKCEVLDISLESANMYVCLISVKVTSEEKWELFATMNICEEIINRKDKCYIFTDEHNNIVLIFKDSYTSTINLLLENCLEKLSGFLKTQNVASVGVKASSYRMLAKSYDSAIRLLNFQLVYGSAKVFSFENYDTNIEETPMFLTDFAASIENWEIDAVNANVEKLFFEIEKSGNILDPDILKYSIVDVMSYILYRLFSANVNPEFIQKLKDEIYERIQSITTQEELKKLLRDFSTNIIGKLSEKQEHNYSQNISTAVDYINNKFYDPNISLKTMANQLGVNAAYLGRQFKQETNYYFSDYLNEKRVNEANLLLQNTNMKANEISEKVGFSGVSYFYTVFKKITGKNPGDLRK